MSQGTEVRSKATTEAALNLTELSHLTGFPIELLKKELLLADEDMRSGLTLEALREKMLLYVDKIMLDN